MRIISDFHDYYDCAQKYGQDQSIIWLRKQKEIQKEIGLFTVNLPIVGEGHVFIIYIGFCGKIYNLMVINLNNKTHYLYNETDWNIFYANNKKKIEKYRKRYKWMRFTNKYNIATIFSHTIPLHDLFVEHRSPVFTAVYSAGSLLITINDKLEPLQFYRVFDPYTAFQQITMFYSGVLGGPREVIPEVSDKDLITAKGFDKFSFRKEKE